MTLITLQDGKPVMRDGKVGTGQACCCGGDEAPTCCIELYEIVGGFAWEPGVEERYQDAYQEMCDLGSWNFTIADPPYYYAWVYTKKPCSECTPFETDVPRDTTGLGTGFGGGPYGTKPRGLISRVCVPVVDAPYGCTSLAEYQAEYPDTICVFP